MMMTDPADVKRVGNYKARNPNDLTPPDNRSPEERVADWVRVVDRAVECSLKAGKLAFRAPAGIRSEAG
jgi:hypothetical protein